MKRLFFLITIAAIAMACRTPKVVTVTEYRDRVQTDTTVRVDSIYVAHYVTQRGDTIRMTDTIYQYRIIRDTRDVYVRDSIPYTVEVVTEVRKRNGYDKFTAAGFWIFVAIAIGWTAWKIGRALARIYLRR